MNILTADGRLVADPETFTTKNDKNIVSFTIANDVGYGEYKKTNFYKCKVFGKTGEAVMRFAKKGMDTVVTGEHIMRVDEKDGKKYYNNEISVRDIKFIFKDKVENNQSEPEGNSFSDDSIPF